MAKNDKITALLEQLLVALKSDDAEAKPKRGRPAREVAPSANKKRGRPPKQRVTEEDNTPYKQPELEEVILESLQKPKKRKKTKDEILAKSTTEDKIRARTGREKRGTQARRMQLTVPKGGRPNLFEDSVDFNAHKEDTKIDKLLNKGRKPTPRIGIARTKVDVECFVCGDICSVHPGEVSSEGRYRCQDCIGKEVGFGSDEDDYEVLDDDS